jgi:hydrogenase nickel incorporation protein HypB
MSTVVPIGEKVLSENDRLASDLRARFARHRIAVLNLVSSPGSGKTSLLERTLAELGSRVRMAVIVGDVETENDARRLERGGGQLVRPIVTRGACHLDARMVTKAVAELKLESIDLLFIENVGNLVCPSSYDLGEEMKVVLISTTEGDDKPLKYPGMFRRSGAMVINKVDLLGTSDFDLARVRENALTVNGGLEILAVSCRTGEGLADWYEWLKRRVAGKREQPRG